MAKKFFIIFGILFFAASAFAGEWKMRYNSFTRKQDWIRGDDPVFTSITADTLSDGTLTITGGSITDLVNLTGTGTLTIDDIDLDGSITMDDTETVDGVDISVLDSTVAALDLDAVSDVGATTDQIITTGGYTTDGTLTDGTLEISGGNLSTTGTLGAGAITGTSLDAGSGTIQTTGAITDGTFSVDDGVMTGIASLNGAGTIDLEDNLDGTGFTGTFGQIIDNGLSASLGVYTNASSQLTSTIPTTDNINLGFWNRTGTTLTQAHDNDRVYLGPSGKLLLGVNSAAYSQNLSVGNYTLPEGGSGGFNTAFWLNPISTPSSASNEIFCALGGYNTFNTNFITGKMSGLVFGNYTVGAHGNATMTLKGIEAWGIGGYYPNVTAHEAYALHLQSTLNGNDDKGIGFGMFGGNYILDNIYTIKAESGGKAHGTIGNEYVMWIGKPTIATTNYQLYLDGNGAGSGIWFDGAERLYSDDTNLVTASPFLALDKILFTQTDGNEYIDSLADNYLDLGATTGIRLTAPLTTVTGDAIVSGTLTATDLVIGGSAVDENTYVPYTGADTAVNLGSQTLTTTGTGTFGEIIDDGLTASLGVYTDASSQLTSTIPTTGDLGFWNKTGTDLSTAHANDTVFLGTGGLTFGTNSNTTTSALNISNYVLAGTASSFNTGIWLNPMVSPTEACSGSFSGLAGYVSVTGSLVTGKSVGLIFGNYTVGTAGNATMDLKGIETWATGGWIPAITGKDAMGIHVQSTMNGSDDKGIATGFGWGNYTFDNIYTIKAESGGKVAGTIGNEYVMWIGKPTIATTNYQLYLEGNGVGSGIWFDGAERLYSDGTNLTSAAPILALDKIKFTQTDGNEYIDSLATGYMDYGATTAHRFNNQIDLATDKKLQLRDSAIGIYSQADTFMDLFADGGVRIGNSSAGAPTTYMTIEPDADTFWVGAGSGLPYGDLYVHGNSTGQTISTATLTQVTTFDTAGESNLTTPSVANSDITIIKTGRYFITLSSAFSGDANVTWLGGVYKNNGATQLSNLQTARKLGAGGDVGSVSISGIASLTADDTVEVWFQHAEGVDKSITVQELTLSIVMVGG